MNWLIAKAYAAGDTQGMKVYANMITDADQRITGARSSLDALVKKAASVPTASPQFGSAVAHPNVPYAQPLPKGAMPTPGGPDGKVNPTLMNSLRSKYR